MKNDLAIAVLVGIGQVWRMMAELRRFRVALTGFSGAPGVATFYFLDSLTALASLHTLWNSMATKMPTGVQIHKEPVGDIVDETTGEITGSWNSAPVADSGGSIDGAYAAPSGGCLTWSTSTIADGHRLKGRTFIVPMGGSQYEGNGTLNNIAVGQMQAAATQFVQEQSTSFVIWHRPKFGPRPGPGLPRPIIRNGSHGLVTGSGVRDKAAVLRSRRD